MSDQVLQLPRDYRVPEFEELVADARAILSTNRALDEQLGPGLHVSPLWENADGEVGIRLTATGVMRPRYFEYDLRELGRVLPLVCDLVSVFASERETAVSALENTHRAWFDDGAPVRRIGMPYKGHFRLLSLLLADAARKRSAGLASLEWCASVGVIELIHDPEKHPPLKEIWESSRRKYAAMLEHEMKWLVEVMSPGSGGPFAHLLGGT